VTATRAVTVEPRADTLYRLSAGSVTGPVVSVGVAPQLEVTAAGVRELVGEVQPVVRGEVTVLRRVGAGWKVVAHPQVDSSGRFSTPLRLRAGRYRVTTAADGRYASASRSLRVTPRLLATLAR
jgi:hypothetical protein